MIPLWAILGLSAALLSTAIPLVQERMRADGFAVAVWVKVAAVILSSPFVLYYGLPSDPKFYGTLACTALLWCVSDVIYFRSVPLAGAGVISRVLPSAVIITFVLWFFVDDALIDRYLANPAPSLAIVAIIGLSALFAMMIRKDPVSWRGVRLVWFVIFAACVGPIIEKVSLGYAPGRAAPFAFMFFQGLFMLGFWWIYFVIRRPISARELLSSRSVRTGASIGAVATAVLYLKTAAMVHVEQPAFLSVLLFTDALWILLIYRLTGRHDPSNIWAGLGIVGCAIALILVKTQV
jgi:hypothetical protein